MTLKGIFLGWLLLWGSVVLAQGPVWNWATTQGYSIISAVGTDEVGNIYTCQNSGSSFTLRKHTAQSQSIWEKNFTGNCGAFDMATDKAGNCYLTGYFSSAFIADSISLNTYGSTDIFIIKLDSAGQVLWARQAGGSFVPVGIGGTDFGYAIGIDSSGNSYVTGIYQVLTGGFATFGHLTTPVNQEQSIPPMGFLAKYDPNGQIQWLNTFGPHGYQPNKVAVTPAGECFVAGGANTLTFGNGTVVTAGPLENRYYARFNTAGDLIWARHFGNHQDTYVNALAVNQNNDFYLSISLRDTLTFSGIPLVGPSNRGANYLIKGNPDGSLIWADAVTGTGELWDQHDIALDADHNIYLCAPVHGQISFAQQSFTSQGTTDPIVLKWSSNGNQLWGKMAQGPGYSIAQSIALDPTQSKCYLSGFFTNSISFGNQTLTASGEAFFLAELGNIITATPEATAATPLNLYPNPSHSRRLLVELPQEATAASFVLTDVRGQTVHTGTFSGSGTTELELPQLPAGTYLLTVQTAAKVWRQKVVLQ